MDEVIAYHVDKTAALQAGQVIGFEPAPTMPVTGGVTRTEGAWCRGVVPPGSSW
jgi:hypothetical protein